MGNIKLFESKQIRSTWDEREQRWYFSVVDAVAALTDSPNPRDYWYRIKQREKISGIELSTICRQFKPKLAAPDKAWTLPNFPIQSHRSSKRPPHRRSGLCVSADQKALKESCQSVQSMTVRPGTRLNPLVLLVASVTPSETAWAAISRPIEPMGVPAFSSAARVSP